jgi:hypothetical protein
LVHLRALRAGLHVHDRRLLVSLLRSLVAHHRRSRARAREVVATRRHVTRVLRVAGRLCIHLHLRLGRHAHERPVRRVLLHHMSAHLRSRAINELTCLWTANASVLHARAHTVLRYLHRLWVARHWLRLRIVHVRGHLSWRRVN